MEGRPKTIFRVVKDRDNPYVMIDKRIAENTSLSWKAKGILFYILSRPDDWEVNAEDLINRSSDGATAVYSGIRELRRAGYIELVKMRLNGKFTCNVYRVFEKPTSPLTENRDMGNRDMENQRQVNTELTNNKYLEISSKTEIKPNLDALDGMIHFANQAPPRMAAGFPEYVGELAQTFINGFGRPPVDKAEKSNWIKGLQRLQALGITPVELDGAFEIMKFKELTIKSPESLRAIAENIHVNKAEDDRKRNIKPSSMASEVF